LAIHANAAPPKAVDRQHHATDQEFRFFAVMNQGVGHGYKPLGHALKVGHRDGPNVNRLKRGGLNHSE
jgi:hypothetical protein